MLSGWAPVLYPAIVAGAAGGILAVANVLPDQCVALFEHARAGRHAEALALQRSLTKIAMHVSSVHGIAGLKAALEMTGYHGGPVAVAAACPCPTRFAPRSARASRSAGQHR